MADEDKTTEGGEGGEAEMTMSQVTAILKEITPLIQELTKAKESLSAEAGSESDPAAATLDEDEKDDKKADGMDSKVKSLEAEITKLKTDATKKVMADLAARNDLYAKVSQHTGAFDHAEMNASDVAKYGVKKLGIACDSGQEIAAIKGFLHGRNPVTFTQASDSATSNGAKVVDAYFGSAK